MNKDNQERKRRNIRKLKAWREQLRWGLKKWEIEGYERVRKMSRKRWGKERMTVFLTMWLRGEESENEEGIHRSKGTEVEVVHFKFWSFWKWLGIKRSEERKQSWKERSEGRYRDRMTWGTHWMKLAMTSLRSYSLYSWYQSADHHLQDFPSETLMPQSPQCSVSSLPREHCKVITIRHITSVDYIGCNEVCIRLLNPHHEQLEVFCSSVFGETRKSFTLPTHVE